MNDNISIIFLLPAALLKIVFSSQTTLIGAASHFFQTEYDSGEMLSNLTNSSLAGL
jgi:hypothetical protein